MRRAAGRIFLLVVFVTPMVAGKHHDLPSTDPTIYIERLNTGLFTFEGEMDLRKAIIEKHVPIRVGDKTEARYLLRYEGKDYKDCATTDVVPLPGMPGMGGIVCVSWNTGVTITKVNLVDADTQQAIWSYDIPKKTSWPAGDAAKHLKHFLEKENKH
jgi:hypothetical protein